MGPKPRPVPPLSVTDSKILNVMRNAGGIGNAWDIPEGKKVQRSPAGRIVQIRVKHGALGKDPEVPKCQVLRQQPLSY